MIKWAKFWIVLICVFLLAACKATNEAQIEAYRSTEINTRNISEENEYLQGEQSLKESEETDVTSNERVYEYLNTDGGHKIWYGKWVVEKKIGDSKRLDVQDIDDLIGKEIFFGRWQSEFIYYEEEIKIEYPKYEITIIPLDENTTYFPYMPRLKDIGISGEYVTIFWIPGYDVSYIVKDEDTLIMFTRDAYLELKRLEYIEGYDSFYRSL